MAEIHVRLPDGSERKINEGTTALELAAMIASGLAKRAVVARVNGQIKDLQDPLQDQDQVTILDSSAKEAHEVISHSAEHVMAAAVTELFLGAQVTMGPKDHSEGFYYDFDIGRPFTEEDIVAVQSKMAELISADIVFKKKWLRKDEAKRLFADLGQRYKAEIIDWIPDDLVSIYQSGSFIDLCRGPHVPHASLIKAFKIMGASGSYWRGDSSREMLQRLSGIAFSDKKELDTYLMRLEEAKKRDHRKIGPKQDLFFVSERFNSQNVDIPASEVRALVYIPDSILAGERLADVMKEVESLIKQIKGIMPGELRFNGINIVAKPGSELKEAEVDLRIFAKNGDHEGRVLVLDAVKAFNDRQSLCKVKCLYETQAVEEIGPGLVMWLPKGGRLRALIEDFSRNKHFAGGYDMVYSPHIAKSDLWRISGHLGYYRESMFAPMNVDGNEYMLKPMNCPFHALMYKHKPRSYRDLPLRLAEFGTVYRYELAGVLHGLMRVRGFTQDDAHIFCRWDQLDAELDKVLAFILEMLKAFGFSDFEVNISTRPEKYVGELSAWDRAEHSLKEAVLRTGLKYSVDEGGGAFYGPKVDLKLRDCLGRLWQCSTLQLDFNNPHRFQLEYVNSSGQKEEPVMLHRALFGSIERFIGILIEHYAGAFPAWLCPEQVRVLTVSDRHNDFAEQVMLALKQAGIRAEFPPSHEKLSAKIREAQIDKIPIMAIIGDKEVSEKGATLRLRSQEDRGFFPIDELVMEVSKLVEPPK